MKRIAFVVEGQTEQIFVHKFIEKLVALQPYTLQLEKLKGGVIISLGERGVPEEDASHYIRIINAQGDDQVQSFVEEHLVHFRDKGYQAVYGLRDRYSGDKKKRPIDPTRVDMRSKLLQAEYGMSIEFTIAIEEIEAWFLSVPSFFEKYNTTLTLDEINKILGFDLERTSVEALPHPAAIIDKVLTSVGLRYKKRKDDSYKIADVLDYEALYLERSLLVPALGRFVQHLNSALAC